jgi:uncharacterized membrane protein
MDDMVGIWYGSCTRRLTCNSLQKEEEIMHMTYAPPHFIFNIITWTTQMSWFVGTLLQFQLGLGFRATCLNQLQWIIVTEIFVGFKQISKPTSTKGLWDRTFGKSDDDVLPQFH